MQILKLAAILGLGLCALANAPMAQAQSTVECHSRNYQYTECQAPLRSPQLVHQISSSACIINHTWGFNPATRRIWVSQGCSGVFADVGGYHHGRSDSYDPGARSYNDRGYDTGAMTAGMIAGAILGAAADSGKSYSHTTSNYYYTAPPSRPRDTSQDTDYSTPQFDKQGNPNFDTSGGYIGCHGVGCTVDIPPSDDSDTSNDDGNN